MSCIIEAIESIDNAPAVKNALIAAASDIESAYGGSCVPIAEWSAFYVMDDNKVVSVASFFITETDELFIPLSWTHPDHRHKGLYKSLLEAICRFAVNKEYAAISVGIHCGNSISLDVHRKIGFIPHAIFMKIKVDAK